MMRAEFEPGIDQHDELNPKLWAGKKLLPDVESALIKIAQDFKKFIDVPFDVVDLRITGGQVSYFYTKHSDLDLHLVADYSSVVCDREAAELFDAKRLLYKNRFDITVKGIPVELYVEDLDHPAVSASYSIMKRQWITSPSQNPNDIDQEEIKRMSAVWQKIIGHVMTSNDAETAKKTLDLLRNYRKLGLKRTGEYGTANLVYKTLRNSKSVETLTNFIDQEHEKNLSIK
jgi:hypothetical protein